MTRRVYRPAPLTAILLMVLSLPALAGGPLIVGGPNYGVDGQPFTWDMGTMPIQYRVDNGPLSMNPQGKTVIDNATGLVRVRAMFDHWQTAPNTAIAFQYAGPIQPTGSFVGGDVLTIADFNAVMGACDSGTQSPIIFDADGRIASALGLSSDIIGVASPCKLDANSEHISSGFALLNGAWADGLDSDGEVSATQFDQAITHELGHFSGLDHSQINNEVQFNGCDADTMAGLPLMYPILICPARVDSGLSALAPDDQAWIAKLYPAQNYSSGYGTIRGVILFSDGLSQFQGVNVIARSVDSPRRSAVSVVSGYLFTGNPGQSITGDNTAGSDTGSRKAKLIGYYEIPVPPGSYTVEIQSIDQAFTAGSGLGPLDPPVTLIPSFPEFWNSEESAFDDPGAKDAIRVNAGDTVDGIDIILNGSQPRYDLHEDPDQSQLLQLNLPNTTDQEVFA